MARERRHGPMREVSHASCTAVLTPPSARDAGKTMIGYFLCSGFVNLWKALRNWGCGLAACCNNLATKLNSDFFLA